jgi:CRP-like cAMP-binding protein
MYHKLEVPAQCETLWKTCQSLVSDLLQDCPVKTPDLKIVASQPVDPASKSLYFIKAGSICETFEGQVIVIYEEGDLLGADGLIQQKLTAYENDFAVTVDEYDGQQFLDAVATDKRKFQLWNQYLDCLNQSFQILMCHFSQQDTSFAPEFRHYDQGDVIIEEGTEGDEVFTLISGSARVMSNNNEVGEINKDEIFGAIAALTNTKRTASIVAASKCDTIVVKSESFRSLLAARPDTVQKLINDMARTIVSCNERIIELSNNKT